MWKKLFQYFKRQTDEISHEKTWTMATKRKPQKRETESLLIASQNSAIRINYTIAKIDNTQQNRSWRLCGDKDDTIHHIISECSRVAQRQCKRLDMTGWGRWSFGNWARNWNLTIFLNCICTNFLEFWDTNRLLNPGQKTRPSDN